METIEHTQLHPELQGYASDFEAAKEAFSDLAEGLTDEQFNWRPAEDEWSAAECIDHLVALGTLIERRIEEGIELGESRDLRGDGPYKHGWIGGKIVATVGPRNESNKRKFKAPELYAPTSNHTISRLEGAFAALQDELISLAKKSNGLDLGKIRIVSPQTSLIKLSLGQWFGLAANHQKRHIQQANQVKNKLLGS